MTWGEGGRVGGDAGPLAGRRHAPALGLLSCLLVASAWLVGGQDSGGELLARAPSTLKKVGVGRREIPLAIVATIDGSLVAVKADTGSHIWTLGLGDVLLSTWQNKTVFHDNIIIPNTDGSLFLFAAN